MPTPKQCLQFQTPQNQGTRSRRFTERKRSPKHQEDNGDRKDNRGPTCNRDRRIKVYQSFGVGIAVPVIKTLERGRKAQPILSEQSPTQPQKVGQLDSSRSIVASKKPSERRRPARRESLRQQRLSRRYFESFATLWHQPWRKSTGLAKNRRGWANISRHVGFHAAGLTC